MGIIGDLGLSLESGTPAVFTLDPDPLDLGTDASATAELSASRLAGVRVSLDGAIAAVASVATPLSWDGGGCGDGVGEVLEITVTRTGGTAGQTYEGELVIEDDTGAETRFDISLEVPSSLSAIAQAQGWDFIWDFATAGTSQPNEGSGAATALTLTQARATTGQAGALGRFPLSTSASGRASSAAQIAMGEGLGAIVVCLNITNTTSSRAIYSGGGNSNNNKAYLLIGGANITLYTGGLAKVCDLAAVSSGVWLIGLAFDAVGGATCWARKVGSARQDSSGTRGLSLTSFAQTVYLGGDGGVFASVEGDYFFASIRDNATMTSAEFDALFAAL